MNKKVIDDLLSYLADELALRSTSQIANGETIPAGGSNDYTVAIPDDKSKVAITIKVDYDASATDGASFGVYWSPDGTNYDTDTDDSYTLPFAAGASKQKTYMFEAPHSYLKINVANADATYDATVSIWVTYQ